MYKYLILITIIFPLFVNGQSIFKGSDGKVHFISDAPLETIEAVNNELQGVIKTDDQTFAFACFIKDFDGFNSELQKHHFRENYMEMNKFPRIYFEGRIVENIDFEKEASKQVRAKGILFIHGVKKERIIEGNISISEDELNITSEFKVLLENYDINIPKIVSQKIAKEVNIDVNIKLKRE